MTKIGQKNYQVRVYTPSTYYDGIAPDSVVPILDIESYSSKINSGLGELNFTVERTIQNWNEIADIELGKIIELWVNDLDTTDYERQYVGYVSRINFTESVDTRSMRVICLGYVSRLTLDIYKSGTTTTITEATTDPSTMFKNIVIKLRDSANGNIPFINFGSAPNSTIDDTLLSMDATFKQMTYFEAIEQCRKLAPANWWWKLGADNQFYFKAKPIEPTHFFAMGNLQTLNVGYSLENVRNGILIWDKATDYRYLEDSKSITDFGRRIERKVEANADSTGAMDRIANSFIGESKDPRSVISLVVLDNNEFEKFGDGAGYDIESIKVGDTCRISGIAESARTFLSDNMLIVGVMITPTRAYVDVEVTEETMAKFLLNLKNDTQETEKVTIPDTYTAV